MSESTKQLDIVVTPNSHKYKQESREQKEREKLKPVISQNALAKKSFGKRFADAFLSDDPDSLWNYFWKDILIPKGKELFLDALNYAFYHETSDYRRDRRDSYRDYGSYYYGGRGSGSSRSRERDRDRDDRRMEDKDRIDYRNIKTRSLEDADKIVLAMRDRIEDTGEVTIAELFDLVDLPGEYTDTKWGWTNPRDIGVRKVRGAYLIDVAEAKYLD